MNLETPLEPPLHVFRFSLSFADAPVSKASKQGAGPAIADVGFAECSGLEATMEPKVIKEGGRNYGAVQRAGPVTFGTVILKRGMVRNLTLWQWFTEATSQGRYARRRDVTITLGETRLLRAGKDLKDRVGVSEKAEFKVVSVMSWQLKRALPIKVKTADLNAKATEIGVEELHLAHEGLRIAMEK